MTTKALDRNVIRKTLPNGLTVLIKPDHSSPIVAVNVWFGVGSVHETEEMNGLAHFQEHMVFKGTKKYGVGEIANLVKQAGGNLNAGTSYSYTMYYIVLPSRSFETALEIQADAMMNSTFDADEFTKERLVVMDEARMYDDRPESFTFYRTMELAFDAHTYRRPIAGYGPIVEAITRDQLLEFYNNYYRPSNAVLVVVGDVDPDDALERIDRVYGGWEPRDVVVTEPPREPDQRAFRFRAHAGTMDHGYMCAGFHAPNVLHEDAPALEMLSELLSSGRSSRLYRRVREEKQLVTSVGADLLAEKWPGLFLFSASMPPDKWAAARDAIFEEIERFKGEPVGVDELLKARRQIERSMYRDLETMEGQASSMGYYQLLGDYALADRHREAINEVTPERIMEAARKYFHPGNLSLVSYLPESVTTPDAETVETEIRRVLSDDGGVHDMGGTADRIVVQDDDAKSHVRPEREDDTSVKRFTLDNGVRVLLKQRPNLPLASVLTVFQGGSRFEPRGKSGISMITHRAITKGTDNFTAEEIVDKVEGLGGSINSFASFDSGGISLSVLSERLDDALPIYREVVRTPSFDHVRVDVEKARLLEELAKRRDNPIQLTMDRMYRSVFREHPYAHPFLGDPEEAKAVTDVDCARWYWSLMVPANVVLSIVGDVTEAQARRIATEIGGDLKAGPIPTPHFMAPQVAAEPGVHVLRKRDLKQAVTFVGYTAPPMMTEDSLALQVLNGVLTGLGGRLFVELRDKRSLGYMTGSSINPMRERSVFFGYANPGADGIEEAVRVIQHELAKVTEEAVSDEEIERSREWLMGSQVMQLQRNGAQAAAYGTYEALDFGYEVVDQLPARIQKVTKDDLIRVAREVFVPERAVIVKCLPAE